MSGQLLSVICISLHFPRQHEPLKWQNKNCLISIGDILKEYSRDGKQMTQDSLRVLISKLRNGIRKDKACPFIIVKEKAEQNRTSVLHITGELNKFKI